MTNIERAYMLAEKAHINQTYDIYPYIYHIKMTEEVARELEFEENIILACILHDSTEDDSLSYNDIKKAFNEEVAEIVYCVTDELGRNRKERKERTYPKIKANWKATAVKICDRIANIRHSKQYSSEKFKMYKEEHSDFLKNLSSYTHPVEMSKAWGLLNQTLS